MNFLLLIILTFSATGAAAQKRSDKNFYQKDNCLYAWIDDGSTYTAQLHDKVDLDRSNLSIANLEYLGEESNCTKGDQMGQLVLRYAPENNILRWLKLTFQIESTPGWWEVKQVLLDIKPMNEQYYNNTLKYHMEATDFWAGGNLSYSCNSLTLRSIQKNSSEPEKAPRITISLKRFQLQPFESPEIFAPNSDCAVWVTIPMISGLVILILLAFVVAIVIHLMVDLGNQTNDLKFSRQGGMLMNQSQLEATKS